MASSSPHRIPCIDPGLNITGYAVIEVSCGRPKLCEAGVVRGRNKGSLRCVVEI